MPLDARQLGVEGTVDELRRILVEKYRVAKSADAIRPDEPIFSVGVGLSSLDGMELLADLEKRFGVEFKNLEAWTDDSPTLSSVAQYLVDNSKS